MREPVPHAFLACLCPCELTTAPKIIYNFSRRTYFSHSDRFCVFRWSFRHLFSFLSTNLYSKKPQQWVFYRVHTFKTSDVKQISFTPDVLSRKVNSCISHRAFHCVRSHFALKFSSLKVTLLLFLSGNSQHSGVLQQNWTNPQKHHSLIDLGSNLVY